MDKYLQPRILASLPRQQTFNMITTLIKYIPWKSLQVLCSNLTVAEHQIRQKSDWQKGPTFALSWGVIIYLNILRIIYLRTGAWRGSFTKTNLWNYSKWAPVPHFGDHVKTDSVKFWRQECRGNKPSLWPPSNWSHFILWESMFAQSCLALCDPMDCSLPSSAIHGIFQARTLEEVAISHSRGSSWPRDQTCISCIGKWVLYHCATWETYVRE